MSATCAVAAVILISELARGGSALLVMTLGAGDRSGFRKFDLDRWGYVRCSGARGRDRDNWASSARAATALHRVPCCRGRFGHVLCDAAPARSIGCNGRQGSPIALQLYPVLESYFSHSLRAALDPPAFWVVLLPIELPAIYVIGMIALVQLFSSRKFEDDRSHAVRAVAALALTSLSVCWLLTSTLAENDDLGWRAILAAAMALTVLAAAALSGWIAARARIAVTAAGVATIVGLPGGIDVMRSYVTGQTVPPARLFAASSQLWAAVRHHSGAPASASATTHCSLRRLRRGPSTYHGRC
jgi:hypothetical protein